ncbi:hypothetical protein [Hungatella hathewayi]
MKIYDLLTQEKVKHIEKSLINDWGKIEQLGRKILNILPKYELTAFDYNTKEVNEFIDYCRSHYDLLVSINILLTVIAWNSMNEIEKTIIKRLIAYVEERILSLNLLIKILNKPDNNCQEIARFISELLFDMQINLSLDEV